MPKTHTDDVAPALPSSIDGPFQIVDPSDCASWIKADPANARIAAAGNARPTRVLTTGYGRTYLNTTALFIGVAMTARYVNAEDNGGFYLSPIRIPDDMDVGEPCTVKILVTPVQDATTNGQVVRFALTRTRVTLGGSESSSTFVYDWDVPDNWTTSDYNMVTIDNGNGRSFEADTFANGDIVGLRISRQGAATEDTFNKAVKFAEYIQLEYTAKAY